MIAKIDLGDIAQKLCLERGYSFKGHLGDGAFKSAFLAFQGESPLAIKLAVVGGSSERLAREVAALRGCNHPSVAVLLDAFETSLSEQLLWVVLEEYLAGGTLHERSPPGNKLDPQQVRNIGLPLAQVLGHLHERKLVHRDIKPANILFRDESFMPVLTDFGVVRMLDLPTLTRDFVGMGPGTPAYAAPEQLNNEKALIDWRTDQFGLAVVLAECILGRHPFAEPTQSPQQAIVAVATRQPLPAASVSELTDAGFSFLGKALGPWPINRYRRPADFIDAFERV